MLAHHGECQGTYELSASVNGKPSWTSQSTAIWGMQNSNMWIIGNLDKIGTYMGTISTSGMLFGANENGKWNYFDGKMCKKLDTNDFRIECIAREGKNQQ